MTASAQDTSGRKILNKMTVAIQVCIQANLFYIPQNRMRNGQLREKRNAGENSKSSVELLCLLHKIPVRERKHCGGEDNLKGCWSMNGFPTSRWSWVLRNPLLRKKSHHSILELGFDYLIDLVEYYEKKNWPDFTNIFLLQIQLYGKKILYCDVIWLSLYNYETTLVRIGETISSIAATLHLNDFSLLLWIPTSNRMMQWSPGQVIRVLNLYCKKIVLYVDRSPGCL